MLLGCLVAAGAIMVAAGAVLALLPHLLGAGIWLLALGLAAVLGVLFERRRYKPILDAPPGPGWVATRERFVDEQSGATVVVWYNPRTGQRTYVRA